MAFLMVPTPENNWIEIHNLLFHIVTLKFGTKWDWWQNVLLCMCLQVDSNWKLTINLLGFMHHLGLALTLVITMYGKQL